MQKNQTYIIIAAVLAVVALAYWTLRTESVHNAGTVNPAAFAVPDTGAITKIVVTHKGKRPITLAKEPQGWVIDKTVPVAPAHIELALNTLHDLRLKRPATTKERELVIRDLAVAYQKVEVFAGDHIARSFYLGAETDEHQGNYALIAGEEQPAVVYIPNLMGYPAPRLDPDPRYWRSKHIFSSTPRSLLQVDITTPGGEADRLRIKINNRRFEVDGVAHPDTGRVVELLTSMSQIFVENYEYRPSIADSLKRLKPAYTVTVQDLSPLRNHTLWLYPTAKAEDNADRMFAYIPDLKLAATIQPQNFKPLMHGKAWIEGKTK